jgi:glycosyltransferase involved in cell wall biosynthesis
MKISFLASDLSRNCVGRVYALAKMVEPQFTIEIIGPLLGERIWAPCDTGEFTYKPVRCTSVFPRFLKDMKELESLIGGDIVYASKPWLTSFGVGVLAKLKRKKPLVLDIDDWELGWYLPYRCRKMASLSVRSIRDANGFLSTYLLEKMIFLADGITTASKFLQNRFDGEYIPHARDTDVLDPSKYNQGELKKKHGFGDEKIIMFLGSPRPHKGLRILFKSLQSLKRSDVKLVIIGSTNEYPLKDEIPREIVQSVVIRDMIPFSHVPDHLSYADVVVVPQNNLPSNHAQVPAKLFDAMAMAKPIISTRISDMPEILSDCGYIAETNDPQNLAEKIHYVLTNPAEAEEMGRRAREKCVHEYSVKVVGKRLTNYVREAIR